MSKYLTFGPHWPATWRPGSVNLVWARLGYLLRPAHLVWALPCLILAGYAASHYWVCDDAHISFRYAHHLFAGNGLVFNLGERVEGYTNFLWLIEVGLLSRLGVSMPAASSILSVLATAGVVLLTVRCARRGAFPAVGSLAAWVALVLLATNRNVAIFTTSGLETRQFTLLLLLGLALVRSGFRRSGDWVWASLAFGALELTRPEGALLGGCAIAWVGLELVWQRRALIGPLLRLALPFTLIVVVHYLWRHSYYGEWLPNTYYAKAIRPWPDMGVLYFGAAFLETGAYLTIPLALIGGALRWARRGDHGLLLGLMVVVPHMVYLISVGGDHFEFRPLDFYWPLLAIGVADSMAGLMVALRLYLRRRGGWRPRLLARLPWAAALAVLLIYSTTLPLAQYVIEHPHRSDPDIKGHIAEPISIETFPLAYAVPFLGPVADALSSTMAKLIHHNIGVRWIEHHVFERKVQRLFGPYNRPGRERFPPSGVMNFSWMGIGPFALPEVTIIDNFGLTDKVVARNRWPRNKDRSMAHDRRAPRGYMAKRGVNFRIQPAERDCRRALRVAPYALWLAPDLCAPFVSNNPRWVRQAFSGKPLFHIDWKRPARSIVFGRTVRQAHVLLDCEGGEDSGWELEGARCTTKPGARQTKITGHEGAGWLSTYHPTRGDKTTGRARSPWISVSPHDAILLKLGGGRDPKLRVALVDESGEEKARLYGSKDEALQPYWLDLHPFAGARLRLEVVDETPGAWGHLLVDHVLHLETRPAASPPG